MSRRRLASIFVPLVIVVVVVLGISLHQQIKNQLNAWKLLPQPERLTELYFTEPNSLPSKYVAGKAQGVHFTVHNIEYQSENYPYKIVEHSQDGNQSKQLSNGSFTLQQNQYEGMNVNVTPLNMGSRAEIIIELPTVNENISYWVEQQS